MGYAPNDPRRGGALQYGRQEDAFARQYVMLPILQYPVSLPMAFLDSGSLSSLPTGPIFGLPRDLHRP